MAIKTSSDTPPAAPGTAKPHRGPPASTTGPVTPVPSDAPTVNVVTSQENASVTVPRGACRSTSTKAQAIAGARNRPATTVSNVMATGPGVSISGR